MAAEHLQKLSPEQMAEMRAKAAVAKAEKAAQNKCNEHLYKLEYMDSNHWAELGTKYRVRFPTYNEPASPSGIRKMLRKCGVDNETFKEHYKSVDYFVSNNPKWTLAAVTGLLLEIREGM